MKRGKRKILKQIVTFALSLCLISSLINPMEARAVSANSGNQTFCAGTYFSAFIKEDNSLWTCGGSGTLDYRYNTPKEWNWMQGSGGVPIKVMDDAKSVYSNGDATCYVIKTDNTLWALGENDGAFGDGTLQHSKTPVKIMDDVVCVESKAYNWAGASDEHGSVPSEYGYASIALKSDGTLWSWGTNHWGEVGDGTKEPRLAPVKVMDNVVCATNNEGLQMHTADKIISTHAIKTDGSLWAWGSNDNVQLGDGTMNSQATPVKITDNVQTITADDGTCTIIKKDGSCWFWGRDLIGADAELIGKVYFRPIKSPKKITDDVQSVVTSANDKYFVKKDGSLWAWGNAPKLDLVGSGQPFNRTEPIKIMDSVRYIHQGDFTTFAIRTDNSLWGWGFNDEGQIGIGDATIECQTNPIVIMDNVFSVYTTSFDTYILRTDGTLWGCGGDNYCQLGQGANEWKRPSLVKIVDNVRIY